MAILLLAEHTNSALGGATHKALSAALQIGGDIHVLVAGHNCKAAADAAAKLKGVSKVLVADAPQLANGLAEEVAALMVSLAVPMARSSRLRRLPERTRCRASQRFSTSCRSRTLPR